MRKILCDPVRETLMQLLYFSWYLSIQSHIIVNTFKLYSEHPQTCISIQNQKSKFRKSVFSSSYYSLSLLISSSCYSTYCTEVVKLCSGLPKAYKSIKDQKLLIFRPFNIFFRLLLYLS